MEAASPTWTESGPRRPQCSQRAPAVRYRRTWPSSRPHPLPTPVQGAALLSKLRGDLHMHSDWSDGGSPIREMARTAAEIGHEYVVLTDHSPSLRVANGLTADRLREELAVVD